jgi:hypothetical protein
MQRVAHRLAQVTARLTSLQKVHRAFPACRVVAKYFSQLHEQFSSRGSGQALHFR